MICLLLSQKKNYLVTDSDLRSHCRSLCWLVDVAFKVAASTSTLLVTIHVMLDAGVFSRRLPLISHNTWHKLTGLHRSCPNPDTALDHELGLNCLSKFARPTLSFSFCLRDTFYFVSVVPVSPKNNMDFFFGFLLGHVNPFSSPSAPAHKFSLSQKTCVLVLRES